MQPVTRAGEPPSLRERVHDDHLGVRGVGPGHDRLVDLVEGGRALAPGEHRHQGDLSSWRLGPDHGHRLLDPEPLQVRRYRHVVVAGLHDDQRGPERAQVDPGDLGGDRALPAEAGVYVAGPGTPYTKAFQRSWRASSTAQDPAGSSAPTPAVNDAPTIATVGTPGRRSG